MQGNKTDSRKEEKSRIHVYMGDKKLRQKG